MDTSAPGGEMLYRIKGAIAREEWKRKRDAWSRAVRRMIDAGQHHTGTVPIGYRNIKDEGGPMHGRLEPDPATRALVVELFERRARGQSWVSLARWMAEQGHPRSESGVKSTIHNPAYLGQARYGELVKEGAHEALVGKGLWRRANEPGRKSSRDGGEGGVRRELEASRPPLEH